MKNLLNTIIPISCITLVFGLSCQKSGNSNKTPTPSNSDPEQQIEVVAPNTQELSLDDCAKSTENIPTPCTDDDNMNSTEIKIQAEDEATTATAASNETIETLETTPETVEEIIPATGSPALHYEEELSKYERLAKDPAFANLPYPTNSSEIKYGDDALKTITLYHTYFTGIKVYYGSDAPKNNAALSTNSKKLINVEIQDCEVYNATLVFCDKSIESALGDMPLAKRADVAIRDNKLAGNISALKPYGEILIVETLTRADMFAKVSHIGFYFDAPNLLGVAKNKLKLKENGIITLADGSLGYIHQFAVVNRHSQKSDTQDDWYSEFKPHIVTRGDDASNIVYWDRANDNYRLWESKVSGVNIEIDLMDLAASEHLIYLK